MSASVPGAGAQDEKATNAARGEGGMDRDEIIRRLVKAFGPHREYQHATRSYEPNGNDAEATCVTTFPDTDGHLSIRSLTYGEIADALVPDGSAPVQRDAQGAGS